MRREFTRAVAATWLAFGLDTGKNTFWRQSRVAEHTELAWYLSCFTPKPMLENATSYKDKVERSSTPANTGLFVYPVLQAADILLYDAEIIPVGKDQRQHIEMTRDIASAFNREYDDAVFVLPEPRIDERLMTIPGIDGAKMSKSYNNYIDIFCPKMSCGKSLRKSNRTQRPSKSPRIRTLTLPFSCIRCWHQRSRLLNYAASTKGVITAMVQRKERFMNSSWEQFATERERFTFYMANNDALEAELRAGEEKPAPLPDAR